VALATGASVVLWMGSARAANEPEEQGPGDIEHTIVVGAGGAFEVELRGGAVHPGANVMIEWEAVENWIELELEASALSADGGVEVPLGLLVKKPFRLTRWSEFMIGIGPEVVHVATPTTRATVGGVQAALDFMFWPSQHVGLWVEPSYDLLFADPVSHGLGSTGGLIFGW